ncbi:hypothetical protein JYK17_17545 [Streptomyces sp. KC 17012]|jgi:hypothetical protein|nr:hypothetical protein [Streptomyces plumbidurans]MBY8341835.1 hypothetical protein [Streptomyces plumbidurans]
MSERSKVRITVDASSVTRALDRVAVELPQPSDDDEGTDLVCPGGESTA